MSSAEKKDKKADKEKKKHCEDSKVSPFKSSGYDMVPLQSDIANTAELVDPKLVNPWGIVIEESNKSVWVADNGTGFLTNYKFDGHPNATPVTIPGVGAATGTPSGLVLNETAGFVISSGSNNSPSKLIIVSEDGTISGFHPSVDPNNAIAVVSSPTKVFKGVTLIGDFLFVTNFHDGVVEKYDSKWNLVGQFTDVALTTAGYAPFGIAHIKKYLYVTFALQDPITLHDDVKGVGNGFIDIFDTEGSFIKRFANRGALNSPWAVVAYHHHDDEVIFVGNFGDGKINVFDLKTGVFLSDLKDRFGNHISIDGLWGLVLSPREHQKHPRTLFFSAGINSEGNGLFGKLR
jgi:uncharacterized protein (TIGR03118 family)